MPTNPIPAALEPCPFCGGDAYSYESVNGTSMVHVGCAPCGVDIKAALVPVANGVGWSKDIRASWNRRATPPPTGEWRPTRDDLIKALIGDNAYGGSFEYWGKVYAKQVDRILALTPSPEDSHE